MDDEHLEEDHDMNVYGDDARETMMSDDEISPEEQAFMQGYEEADEVDEVDDDADYERAFKK